MAKKSSGGKVTSPKVAREASQLMRNGRATAKAKSVAGSALAQAKSKKK